MTERTKLRVEAESRLVHFPPGPADLTPEELQRALHELQVHHLELEMQNEELRRTHAELDAARKRYFDLYDLAPVGYLTLSEPGLIVEANLTAAALLGVTRNALAGQPLSRFILKEDQDVYYLHRKQLEATQDPQCFELRMVKMDRTVLWVRLESTFTRDSQGGFESRIVLSDITTKRQLEESSRMKTRAFDASMTANSIANSEGTITEANDTFLRIWGYACEAEVVGNSIPHFFMDQHEAEAILATLNGTGYWQGEFSARRKDGSTFMAHGLGTVVRDGHGTLIGYQSAVVDITEKRQVEEALRTIHQRHRAVLDTAMDGFARTDTLARILEVNAAYCRMSGYSAQELSGMCIFDLDADESADDIAARTRHVMAQGTARFEARHRRKDGSIFEVEISLQYEPDDGGQIVAFVRDITERKRAEEKLRRSEELLNAVQHLSKVGGWLWDVEQQSMFWTEETYRIHDYAPDSLGAGLQDHIDKSLGRCDEADRAWIMATFQRCCEHGEAYDIEYPFTTTSGRRLWLRTSAQAVREGTRIIKVVGNVIDITGRKQAEQALQDSNELLTLFMRCSPIYSFIKAVTPTESRVLHASENYQQMIGIPGTAMVGKTMAELFPAELAAKILADDFAVVATGELLAVDEDFDGRNYHTIKFPIVLGGKTLLGGYTMDITERRQAEQALREWSSTLEHRVAERTIELKDSEARFRQLADATFEGIAISMDGIVLDGNRRFAEIHGYELAEMIGRPVTDFIAPESQAYVTEHIRAGGDELYEFLGMRKDGTVFPAEVRGHNGTWLGKTTRISALRDLTAVKQAAAKLRAQQAELAHAQHLALISEVSAGIVHQLGQPLSAIGANISAMVKLKAAELQQCGALAIIRDIEGDVARMRDIVVHLRALANPMQPTRVVIDFNSIVTGVLPLLRQKAETSRVRLEVDLGDDLPAVQADAVQLSQVILNLVRNAFDASEGGPLERRVVVVATRTQADRAVELCVRDAGSGIAPDTMRRLFSPFFSTKTDGLGVGLRLSQTIVHAHGGSIEGFNNPDGVGATFRILLPAPQPNNE